MKGRVDVYVVQRKGDDCSYEKTAVLEEGKGRGRRKQRDFVLVSGYLWFGEWGTYPAAHSAMYTWEAKIRGGSVKGWDVRRRR